MLEKQTLANTGDPPQKPFPYGYVTSETQLLRMVEEREKMRKYLNYETGLDFGF